MPLFGVCRTTHADMLVAAGRWVDAETRSRMRLAPSIAVDPGDDHADAFAARLAAGAPGRLAEAEQLLSRREEEPTSLLALAELRLAEGEPRVAAALLERALAAVDDDVWRRRGCSSRSSTAAGGRCG